MKTILVNVVVSGFFSNKEKVDELYQEIKESKENKWCRYVGEETLIKECKDEEEEVNFTIYAWINEGEKYIVPDLIIDEIWKGGGEGSYSSVIQDDILYDIMWNCVEF